MFRDTQVPIPPYFKGNRRQYVAQMRKFYAMGTWFDDGVAKGTHHIDIHGSRM